MDNDDKKTLADHGKKIAVLENNMITVKDSQDMITKSQDMMTKISIENSSNVKVLVEQVSTVVGEIGKMAKRQFVTQEKNEKAQENSRNEIKELREINHKQDLDELKEKLGFWTRHRDQILGAITGLAMASIYAKLMGLF